ncbi:hypothetical protein OG564_35580 [Streptomyces sp. NBC_01280]|uniref:hypothetical protein n=1 Tax=unclassified Streptomyces TaxID=2593676 RepID=UPI002E2FED1F|nr:hypothetical protein [Streptomyces sp. NBC_01280]WSE13916.1 hypothetical protein OG518_11660 [Streptomyces sp. NBC_01397]
MVETVGVAETAGTGTVVVGALGTVGVVEAVGTGTVVVGVARTPEAARSPQCAARTDSVVVLIRRQPRSRVPRNRPLGAVGTVGALGAVGPLGAVGTGSVVASDGCVTGRRMCRTAEVTRTTPVITARCAIRRHKPRTAEVTRRVLLLIGAAPSGSRGS